MFCCFWKADSLAEVHVKPFKKTSCVHQRQWKGHVGIPPQFSETTQALFLHSQDPKKQLWATNRVSISCGSVNCDAWLSKTDWTGSSEQSNWWTLLYEKKKKNTPYLQYILVNRDVPLYLIFIRFYNNLIKHSKFWHNYPLVGQLMLRNN